MSNKKTLLFIVLAQFLCTSLWFAGNAVVGDLIHKLSFPSNAVGHLTSAIQFGFIIGTLGYALLNIADRFSPSKVFMCSAILAAGFNLLLTLPSLGFTLALSSRFFTGFFLAGIYPVGMKIAADHFDKDLGKSLGLLVGALVLGTAFPHLIKSYTSATSYELVICLVSALAVLGGLLILIFVPDGPYRKPSQQVQLGKTFAAFRNSKFRGAAFAYFGHMWELYTFYAFIPQILVYFMIKNQVEFNVSFWSFLIIGAGGLGCALAGLLSQKHPPKVIAAVALSVSGIICFFTPVLLGFSMSFLFLATLLIWGITVAADSPMFSTLVAKNAIAELKGTALTIVNCIGFALTIASIQLVSWMMDFIDFRYLFLILAIGPVFGLINLLSTNYTK